MLAARTHTASRLSTARTFRSIAPKHRLRTNSRCQALLPDVSLIATLADAAPGDVDAPIGVIVGAAIVVTIAATALVPLALAPGQAAADNIFAETRKQTADPLAKKAVTKGKKKSR